MSQPSLPNVGTAVALPVAIPSKQKGGSPGYLVTISVQIPVASMHFAELLAQRFNGRTVRVSQVQPSKTSQRVGNKTLWTPDYEKRDRLARLVRQLLADGPRPTRECIDAIDAAGIGVRGSLMGDVTRKLGVTSRRLRQHGGVQHWCPPDVWPEWQSHILPKVSGAPR